MSAASPVTLKRISPSAFRLASGAWWNDFWLSGDSFAMMSVRATSTLPGGQRPLAAPLLLLPDGQDREAHKGLPEIYQVLRAGQFGRDTGILCDAGRTILAALVAAQPIGCSIDVRR